ncbi:hypothetical protein M8J77_018009 [Diaphorina citri]|nr:hypothetical protein M8J77_018009 [Diaphorina citri]
MACTLRTAYCQKKPDDTEKSYRPICLLDILGKVYEKLIKIRLEEEIGKKGGLSPEQFGFISGRSTVDAMLEVKRRAEDAKKRNKLCALTMVDVKNAFNSTPWRGILEELKRRNIPSYLINVLSSYFQDRTIIVDDIQKETSCGVPQGSVLGALLWNVYYDPLLRITLPPNTSSIAYADDLALITTGTTKDTLEMEINLALKKVNNWMTSKELQIAPQKTEVVMLVSSRKVPEITVQCVEMQISSKPSAKYLGVFFDRNMRMTTHIRKVAEKAEKVATNLSRLMPNINGPKNCKRKLLGSVVYSTLFYGIPAWVDVLQYQKYRTRVEKVQRKIMLRQCRAYRTSPTAPLQVISGTPPVEYMAEERERTYRYKRDGGNLEEFRQDLKNELQNKWQTKWNQENVKGQWTKTLIKNIEPWVNRTYGEVTFELAQFLTGHGNFAAYLKRFRIQEDDKCIYCQQIDTPKHTFFQCIRWQEPRSRCWELLGGCQTEATIISEMLKDKKRWDCINNLIIEIVRKKKIDTQRLEDQEARTRRAVTQTRTNPSPVTCPQTASISTRRQHGDRLRGRDPLNTQT